jgi:hypothetical protein
LSFLNIALVMIRLPNNFAPGDLPGKATIVSRKGISLYHTFERRSSTS